MGSAERIFSILRLYTADRSEWSVDETSAQIGVSASTTYRYFRILCKEGLLDRLNGGSYILGPAIIEYDRQMRKIDPLVKVGQPVMRRLVTRSGRTGIALLCRTYRNCVMCVHQEGELPSGEHVSYERGRLMPMFRAAPSTVIFANLTLRSIRWFFERYRTEIAQANLGSNWEAVKANLRKIRKNGISISWGEVDSSLMGVAAPIFNSRKAVIGSISMSLLQQQASPEAVANVSALVEAAAREIHAGFENDRANFRNSSITIHRPQVPNPPARSVNLV